MMNGMMPTVMRCSGVYRVCSATEVWECREWVEEELRKSRKAMCLRSSPRNPEAAERKGDEGDADHRRCHRQNGE